MLTEDCLQDLLVNDDPPDIPALSAGLAGSQPEGGERPGELADTAGPPVLLRPALSGELVTELWGRVVTSHPSPLLSHLALLAG